MALFTRKIEAARQSENNGVYAPESLFVRQVEYGGRGVQEQAPAGLVGIENAAEDASTSARLDETGVRSVESQDHASSSEYQRVRNEILQLWAKRLISIGEVSGPAKVRQLVEPLFSEALARAQLSISRSERSRLLDDIVADIVGMGPIQPFLDREDVTCILVNGPRQVYIEQDGKLHLTDVTFYDDAHVQHLLERVIAPLGQRIDASVPLVSVRLNDGAQVFAVLPPLAPNGPCLTIRKANKIALQFDELQQQNVFSPAFAQFIRACIATRLNILICGGVNAGKTTLLNALAQQIAADERIIVVEDSSGELRLSQPHIVRLENHDISTDAGRNNGIRSLMFHALHMRPDRLILDEVRGSEAVELLQAWDSGHDGSLTTIYAHNTNDALKRLERLVQMAATSLPALSIRQQIASAVDLVVHIERMRDGQYRLMQCSEVIGIDGNNLIIQDIFNFEQIGVGSDGSILGELKPSGLRPRLLERIDAAGIVLPARLFATSAAKSYRNA
jgi:pilus assembly protein CpaF